MGIEGSSEKLTRGPRLNFLMELTDLPINGSALPIARGLRHFWSPKHQASGLN